MTAAEGATLIIREATMADRPAMLDLWVEAWSKARPEIDFEARRGWLDRHVDALLNKGTCVVAGLLDGRVAGFVTVHPVSGEVDQLVTAASAHRRGLGQALLREAKRIAGHGLVLSVNQFNTPAIRLYEREGFQKTGEGISAGSGLPTWRMRWPGERAL